LAHPLINRTAKSGSGGRIHQFLWRRSRAVGNAKRNCAVRSDEKPLRIESSNLGTFRVQANDSYPEGIRNGFDGDTGLRMRVEDHDLVKKSGINLTADQELALAA
jgi:hypothetical protein